MISIKCSFIFVQRSKKTADKLEIKFEINNEQVQHVSSKKHNAKSKF